MNENVKLVEKREYQGFTTYEFEIVGHLNFEATAVKSSGEVGFFTCDGDSMFPSVYENSTGDWWIEVKYLIEILQYIQDDVKEMGWYNNG